VQIVVEGKKELVPDNVPVGRTKSSTFAATLSSKAARAAERKPRRRTCQWRIRLSILIWDPRTYDSDDDASGTAVVDLRLTFRICAEMLRG